MKFTCTQGNLLTGLQQVVPVVGRNSQLPILQHILFEVRDGALHATTTDLEVGVRTIIGGKAEGEGTFTVPARSLLEYVSQLPSSHPVTVEVKKGGMFIKAGGFQAQFPVGEADDFPLLPAGEQGEPIAITGNAFCTALGQAIFAAARDETRPEIRSVYVQGSEGGVSVAATDSFRLAEEVIHPEQAQDFSLLLPLHCAQEVVRLFATQDEIRILPQENHVIFYGNGIELSSRLVDGSYPDYKQIIPHDWKTRVSVVRDDTVRALKTLLVFLPKDSRRVRLLVAPSTGKILTSVVGSESGQGEAEVMCEGEGEDIEVLVNIQYLLEGLQHITTELCVIEMGGSQSPLVFKPDNKTQEYVYVVMPIQAQ